MKYRKKPVVIDAWQFNGEHVSDLPDFLSTRMDLQRIVIDNSTGLSLMLIDTQHGSAECAIGDWIIKGVSGELYPCKDDIFKAFFEKVEK